MTINSAVIVFPGSNCDRDMADTIESISGKKPQMVWHADTSLPANIDLIAIPGGFSYGDYLRSGAIAAKSPIMNEVIKAAQKGVYVLGVCNGFQVLTESGLLPGVLMRNKYLKFICRTVTLKPANTDSRFTKNYNHQAVVSLPVAHHDGNYFADSKTLAALKDNQQIAFYYSDAKGNVNDEANPNGSQMNIAGILDKNKRILGMMPHPERACDKLTYGIDGTYLFKSIFDN